MATSKPSNSMEIEDIQRRMAQLRYDMHGEVLGAVKGAQSLTDWRSFARNHPWLTLGVATAIGYFVVPRRRSEAPTILAVNARSPEVASLVEPQKTVEKNSGKGWSLMGTIFSLVAPIAVRAAQNYTMRYVEEMLAPHESPPEETERGGRRPENSARATTPLGPSGRFRESR